MLADVAGRGGDVVDQAVHGSERVIVALVPLRALFGHVSDLRSRTVQPDAGAKLCAQVKALLTRT